MARHINRTRNAASQSSSYVSRLFSEQNSSANFAAFGGSSNQRSAVGIRGISRCIGKTGIILLQNSVDLSYRLQALNNQITANAQTIESFRCYSINPYNSNIHYYDPLYGMTLPAILDTIAPLIQHSPSAEYTNNLRTYLSLYLTIMQHLYARSHPQNVKSPYSLDLLYDLVSLPLSVLDANYLTLLPLADRTRALHILSQPNAVNQAYSAVDSFARPLSECLWTRRGAQAHTCINMIEAAERRQLINIRLSSPSDEVIYYISQELHALRQRNTPFLLLSADLPLEKFPDLQQFFTDIHPNFEYTTGLLASGLSDVCADAAQHSLILNQLHEYLVFVCSSTQQAQPFSDALGSYWRTMQDMQINHNREPFHWFANHGHAIVRHEVMEPNITPQEFLGLGNDAVLSGSLYKTPVMIRNVILN